MEIADLFPEQGSIQRLYCDECRDHLDLIFTDFHELVTGVDIEIKGLPMLYCKSCDKSFIPDDSRYAVIHLHEQAVKNSSDKMTVTRNKTNQVFGFGVAPFIYDSDDYKYIPGLKRPSNDGFLTPVFFKREVLLKYDTSPTYRLSFASTTYGEAMIFQCHLALIKMARSLCGWAILLAFLIMNSIISVQKTSDLIIL